MSNDRLRPERFTAFVDAVVAIAMTLLILPLMESVSEAADARLSTVDFLVEHRGQLVSFALSFLLIALFWTEHHRVYSKLKSITQPLIWINIGWLFTIVWLPVPTAMVGQMPVDSVQAMLYIGTLIATQILTLAAKTYLLRNPELTQFSADELRRGITGDLASATLFSAALILAAWAPAVGYYSLFLLLLTGPVSRLIARMRRRRSDTTDASQVG